MGNIDNFLNKLSDFDSTSTVYNPYLSDLCMSNLKNYIDGMKQSNSNVLIVGEAPGYNGCRLTGVPFSSEYILSEDFHLMNNLFPSNSFKTSGKQKEASATIVWNGFNYIGIFPIMWNAFPFHPHKDGNDKSNRPPTKQELEIGKTYLHKYIALFERELNIWAIGKKSHEALRSISIDADYIRHPANGGKIDFLKGLQKIKEGLCS